MMINRRRTVAKAAARPFGGAAGATIARDRSQLFRVAKLGSVPTFPAQQARGLSLLFPEENTCAVEARTKARTIATWQNSGLSLVFLGGTRAGGTHAVHGGGSELDEVARRALRDASRPCYTSGFSASAPAGAPAQQPS